MSEDKTNTCVTCDHSHKSGQSSPYWCDKHGDYLSHPTTQSCEDWRCLIVKRLKPESMDQAVRNLLAKVDPLQAENEELRRIVESYKQSLKAADANHREIGAELERVREALRRRVVFTQGHLTANPQYKGTCSECTARWRSQEQHNPVNGKPCLAQLPEHEDTK